jgi:hypothetical protein
LTCLRLLGFRDGYYAGGALLDHLNSDGFDYWSDGFDYWSDGFDYWSDGLFRFPRGFLHWRTFRFGRSLSAVRR